MYELSLIIILGLIAGSFINMASYRLTLENAKFGDLLMKRSFCPKCKNSLTIKNLIPLFSWIFQKGCCSFCNCKIPIRYPLIEIATTILFIFIFINNDQIINAKLTILLFIAMLLTIMVITDLEHYFIPDSTQILLFGLIIFYHFSNNSLGSFWYYIGSGAAFCIFGFILNYSFLLITKKHGLGIDDIKFFAVTGFAIGMSQLAIFMLLSGFLGTIFGLIWQKVQKDDTFPFAPALALSLLLCLIFSKHPYLNFLS